MPKRSVPPSPACPALTLFTAPERDLIRREFPSRFGQDPSVADGIMLRTWRGGLNAGQPKLPPPVQSLLARGLQPCCKWAQLGLKLGWKEAHSELSHKSLTGQTLSCCAVATQSAAEGPLALHALKSTRARVMGVLTITHLGSRV